MAYNQDLAHKIKLALLGIDNVAEKFMFGGVCFMVDDKMCIGVNKEQLMCRINPDNYDNLINKNGASEMKFTGRAMKGFIFVDETAWSVKKEFDFWMKECLEFNKIAKASKKKVKK